MANDQMMAQMSTKPGFIAALDQSGGSTPGALRLYGIPDSEYKGDDAKMFELVHEMRVRIITAPAFNGDKVIAAILFERTMDGEAKGKPVPTYLWEDRGVVPFVKVDKGLEAEKDGVSLMKPMPDLDKLLARAVKLGVFGTKMRSVINLASKTGIAAIAKQQFEFGEQIAKHGLTPILEPEISIKSPDKAGAERILLDELTKGLDALPAGRKVMFKLTLPEVPDFYQPLIKDKRVVRVVALSGGYTRDEAVRASRQKSRHDRELLARARRGPQAFDDRRRVRQSAGRCDRRDLSRLDGEGLRGGGQVLLRLGLTLCVAGLARARAQGHSLSSEDPVVLRRRSEDAGIRRAQSAPAGSGAGRRRFRPRRICGHRRVYRGPMAERPGAFRS